MWLAELSTLVSCIKDSLSLKSKNPNNTLSTLSVSADVNGLLASESETVIKINDKTISKKLNFLNFNYPPVK